jgi:ubiquinone/menaquinone biosynthesis C-methylase UbiE
MNEFDEKAKQWDQNQMHLDRTKAVAAELLRRIPVENSMKALEFGAGTGLLSFYLKDQLGEITLMDTSREMLAMAENKLEEEDMGKIRTVNFDLEESEYTDWKFDIIYTQMVLHHVTDVKRVLERFYNMLSPDGYLAIADLNSEDGSFHEPGVKVHHGFDTESLIGQLDAIGFGKMESSQCFVIRKESEAGNLKEYPVFLLTAQKSKVNKCLYINLSY